MSIWSNQFNHHRQYKDDRGFQFEMIDADTLFGDMKTPLNLIPKDEMSEWTERYEQKTREIMEKIQIILNAPD